MIAEVVISIVVAMIYVYIAFKISRVKPWNSKIQLDLYMTWEIDRIMIKNPASEKMLRGESVFQGKSLLSHIGKKMFQDSRDKKMEKKQRKVFKNL